jgi:hypothetical protein
MHVIALHDDLIDPVTGECVPAGDVDALISAYERLKRLEGQLATYKQHLQYALASCANGAGGRTQRVVGRKRRARIAWPGDAWDQAILRRAWHDFPSYRDEFLRIEQIGVRVRAWTKAEAEAGPPDLQAFKARVRAANLGPRGAPRITIEE